MEQEIEKVPISREKAFIIYPQPWSYSEAVARKCSLKNMFIKTLQNSQEKTCARVSFVNRTPPVAPSAYHSETLECLSTNFISHRQNLNSGLM